MADPLSLVIASNRGPVSFVEGAEGFEVRRGAGGLAGAMHPVAKRVEGRVLWIASATSGIDRRAIETGAADDLASVLGYPVRLLQIDEGTYSRYYDEVSNRMLWFANHDLWRELGLSGFSHDDLQAWQDAYEPVNQIFADAILEEADDDAILFLQDYHLAVAPRYLRERSPDRTIFHFTHSSFSAAGLRFLPEQIARRVLQGMLGADLLGFHTKRWADEFLEACRWLDAEVDAEAGAVTNDDRRTWVRTYPLSIDAGQLRARVSRAPAQRWLDRFTARKQDILIVRADRTEPSKNIVRGFEAFGSLLDRRPDLTGKIRFIACLYPSRQTLSEYRSYKDAIDRAVDEVNERHPGSIELYLQDDYDRTLAALTLYDVLLVNSIMDGMNLVSKEGPSVNEVSGALVLSRTAGSFSELADHVIPIDDPYDVDETAAALERALETSFDERKQNAEALRASVESRMPEDWIDPQLDDLIAIHDEGTPRSELTD